MYVEIPEHLSSYTVFLYMCVPNSFSDMIPLTKKIDKRTKNMNASLMCRSMVNTAKQNQCPNHKKTCVIMNKQISGLKYC